jgi:hypothetical protein
MTVDASTRGMRMKLEGRGEEVKKIRKQRGAVGEM